jgi:glycosyltransferase involved in cell wall biosynthesis
MSGKTHSKYVAVIPCLNEARTIQELVRGVTQHLVDSSVLGISESSPLVIVVDDGSTDGTGEEAAAAGACVVRHPGVQGKGAALATGLREAQRLGFAQALLLDGDGQHAPADIPAFLQCADKTNAQLIVGNRMHQAERMPWLRRMVNRWMSWRLSRLAGRPLPDSQCGFRLVDLVTWSALSIRAEHFEIESEMLLAFIAARARVEFVPIQVIYKDEQSKIHPWRDTWRWFRWMRRWNASSRTSPGGGQAPVLAEPARQHRPAVDRPEG